MQISSPYEITSQSRAYHRGIPCSVNVLLIRSHTELFQDHWLVGSLLRGGVVGDPLLTPGGTGGVGGFAPAFLQSIDQYLSDSFLCKEGVLRGITAEEVARKLQLGKHQRNESYVEGTEVNGTDVEVHVEIDTDGSPVDPDSLGCTHHLER